MTEIYDRALAPSGLKITMFRVLRRLSNAGRPTITGLARVVGLDRSSLGRNLRILQREGFVRFSDGEDERSRIVQLTPAGRTALAIAVPLWADTQRKMKSVLGKDADAVFAVLARLNEEQAS